MKTRITLTIASLLFAGSLHAQEITAADLGLSNADSLEYYQLNRTTIRRHHEEERIEQERIRRNEIDKAELLYSAAVAKANLIKEYNEAQTQRALQGIERELRDQNDMLREARDCRRRW
jgi:hypothetical protein